jgi:hypothetical protein
MHRTRPHSDILLVTRQLDQDVNAFYRASVRRGNVEHPNGTLSRLVIPLVLRSAWPQLRHLRSDKRQGRRSPVLGAIASEK